MIISIRESFKTKTIYANSPKKERKYYLKIFQE